MSTGTNVEPEGHVLEEPASEGLVGSPDDGIQDDGNDNGQPDLISLEGHDVAPYL